MVPGLTVSSIRPLAISLFIWLFALSFLWEPLDLRGAKYIENFQKLSFFLKFCLCDISNCENVNSFNQCIQKTWNLLTLSLWITVSKIYLWCKIITFNQRSLLSCGFSWGDWFRFNSTHRYTQHNLSISTRTLNNKI